MNTITIFFIFVPVLVCVLLALNLLLAIHRPDSEKVTAYECGFAPVYNQAMNPFTIRFYLIGVLFLVFDIEVYFLRPFSITMPSIGPYGFWILIIFFFVLAIGFVFEFGSGALYFTDHRSAINSQEIKKVERIESN